MISGKRLYLLWIGEGKACPGKGDRKTSGEREERELNGDSSAFQLQTPPWMSKRLGYVTTDMTK